MRYLSLLSLVFSIGILSGCSSTPVTHSDAQTPQTQVTYTDLHAYGVDMGCKAALENIGTPESDWTKAPKLKGSKADYIDGWKQGYEKCRIGLGPVQLPVDKGSSQPVEQ